MRVLKLVAWPAGSVAAATALTLVLWPYIQPSSSPLFFVAVMASSLYGGLAAGLMATAASAASTAFFFMTPRFTFDVGTDDLFRLAVFAVAAVVTSSIAAQRNRAEAAQRRLIGELREANSRIQTLSDLLPICPHCKRVRSAETTWLPLDRYLDEAPDLRVSHALCPECKVRDYPEYQAMPQSGS